MDVVLVRLACGARLSRLVRRARPRA